MPTHSLARRPAHSLKPQCGTLPALLVRPLICHHACATPAPSADLRRRLLEKKSDLRTQTATAVLVREWDAVEQRILAMGPGTRRLRATLTGIAGVAGGGGPGGGAAAAAVVTATVTAAAEARPGGGGGAASAAVASGANAGFGAGATRGGTTGDKDVLAAAGGSGKAAHATRLLGKALEARKRGVMPVTDGERNGCGRVQPGAEGILVHPYRSRARTLPVGRCSRCWYTGMHGSKEARPLYW